MAQRKRQDGAELDWKTAAKRALTTALDKLDDQARETTDTKALESIVKTVADVVGAGMYLERGKTQRSSGSPEGGDDE